MVRWMSLALAATVVVRTAHPADLIYLGESVVQPGTELSFATADKLDLSIESPAMPPLTGALAVLPVAPDRVVSRARLDVARKLSTVPARARVVVLLDASRSLDDDERSACIAVAGAYLSHFPDGAAEVIAFDRAVRPTHGRLVPVARALGDLSSLALTPGNGSAVDLALEQAASLLASSTGGERRIVVFTDTRTREALSSAQLQARFSALRGIVHVAVPGYGAASLDREDSHDWSGLAKSTGGLVWRAYAGQDSDESRAAEVFTELARPVRLHNVKLTSRGFLSEAFATVETLEEGKGLSELQLGKAAGSSFRVEGELWTRRVRSTTSSTDEESRRWAAMVFGTDLYGELSEEEMMVLAKRGGAVSPVTSYLAIEPGVRPSTEGLDESSGEGFGAGGLGLTGIGMGGGGAGGRATRFDPLAWLRTAIGPAWAACGGAQGKARVTIETTLTEIVDVPSVTATGVQPAAATCLREAIWRLELPNEFRSPQASYSLDL